MTEVAVVTDVAHRRSLARTAYSAGVWFYIGGLLLWLTVGLLPPLVSSVGPVRRLAQSVAAGSGPLHDMASEVLLHLPNLPQGLSLAVQYLFSVLNLALGLLLAVRRPHEPVARLLTLAFVGTAATFNAASHSVFHLLRNAPVLTAVHFTFHVASGVAYLWAVLLFPDGRLPVDRPVDRRWAVAVGGGCTLLIAFACWRSSFIAHPPFFVAFFGVLVPIVGMAAQTARLHSGGQPASTRQQARLLRIALTPALAAALLWLGAELLAAGGVRDRVEAAFPALFALVPVMLFVAILRYRLWEIEVALSRTLLFVLLAGFVALVYAAAVGATGWLLRDRGWSAVLAMTVVALAVEPVRQTCRRLTNRLVFGQELTPREAMRGLAERLTRSTSTDELRELTGVVVSGTRCSAAAIWLVLPGRLLLAASSPDSVGTRQLPLTAPELDACRAALPGDTCLAVSHEGALLGVLAVAVPPGVALPAAERRLLGELAGHAGLLVANARLTSDLADQVERVTARGRELRASRQQVVLAQDVERRRLERDIHDGAQQELVAFLVQAGVLQRAPDLAPERLAALRALLADARTTLQDLSVGQVPAVLVQGGLQVALEAAAAPARGTGLTVEVGCRLPARLPVAVEAAVYFCCREALQNAAKHASARRIEVSVQADVEAVSFSVCDDGLGFDPDRTRAGSGSSNLLARLTALGGTLDVSSQSGVGTVVHGRLPVVDRPLLSAAPA